MNIKKLIFGLFLSICGLSASQISLANMTGNDDIANFASVVRANVDTTGLNTYIRGSGTDDRTARTTGRDSTSMNANCSTNKEKIVLTGFLSDNLFSKKNYILDGDLQVSGVVNVPACTALLGGRLIFDTGDKLNFASENVIVDSVNMLATGVINNNISSSTQNIFGSLSTNSTVYRINITYQKSQNAAFFLTNITGNYVLEHSMTSAEYKLSGNVSNAGYTGNLAVGRNTISFTLTTGDGLKNLEMWNYRNTGQINYLVKNMRQFQLDQTAPSISNTGFVFSGTNVTGSFQTNENSLCSYNYNNEVYSSLNSGSVYQTAYTRASTLPYGSGIVGVTCVDLAGNQTIRTGDIFTNIPGAILLSPTNHQLLIGGAASFVRDYVDTSLAISKYTIVIANNPDFASPIVNADTTSKYIQENLTDTGIYYRKIISYYNNFVSSSATGIFYINTFSNTNYPDNFEIIANSGRANEYISIIIKAKKGSDIITGYDGKIRLYLSGTYTVGGFTAPSDYQRSTVDSGIVKFIDKIKFTKSGDYNLVIEDTTVSPLRGITNIHISDQTNRRFQHLSNVNLYTDYTSNPIFANFLTGTQYTSCPNCDIIINDYNKGNYTSVAPGDKVQIRLQSAGSYNIYTIEKVKIGDFYYSFGLQTKNSDGSIDKNDTIITSYTVGVQIYYKLAKAIYQMMFDLKLKGYNLSAIKNSLQNTINDKIRESGQKKLYNNLNTVRNKFVIYESLYQAMQNIVDKFNIIVQNTFVSSSLGLAFNYPSNCTSRVTTTKVSIYSGAYDTIDISKISDTYTNYVTTKTDYLSKYKGKTISNQYILSDYKITSTNIGPNGLESKIILVYFEGTSSIYPDYVDIYWIWKSGTKVFEAKYNDINYESKKNIVDTIRSTIK